MSLFAISDLHLSLAINKPMDKFGDNWINHHEKIKSNWLRLIEEKDTVLLPGDISWGLNLEEAKLDLDFINELPGRKIIMSGNHDYWWSSVSKLSYVYPDIFFLKNDFTEYKGIAICGSRGWICPNDTYFNEQDRKIYLRELLRLRMSLDRAISTGFSEIIVMLHFPPTNDKREQSGFLDIIREYSQIKKVIYGHLHGKGFFNAGIKGFFDGVEYMLVSSDFLDFIPQKII